MIEEVKAMDKAMLEQYEEMAAQVCGLDSAKDAATKHTGLCNLLALLYKDLSVALSPRADDILAIARGRELSFANHKDVVGNPLVMKVIELITKHAAEVEQWEGEDDTTMAERLRMLDEYKNSDKLDWQPIVEGLSVMGYGEIRGTAKPEPDRIYYKNGSFRRYWQCRLTYEYKLLRALQPHTDSDDELETLYKAVMLYVSLMDEEMKVKALIDVLGNTPQNAQNMPNFVTIPQCGISTHPEDVNAPESQETAKTAFFDSLDVVQIEMVDKYFQRAIEAKYMKETNDGWMWQKGRTQPTQMAYFLTKVLQPDEYYCKIPYKAVGKAFGLKNGKNIHKLYSQVNQMKSPKWMKVMEEKVFYD